MNRNKTVQKYLHSLRDQVFGIEDSLFISKDQREFRGIFQMESVLIPHEGLTNESCVILPSNWKRLKISENRLFRILSPESENRLFRILSPESIPKNADIPLNIERNKSRKLYSERMAGNLRKVARLFKKSI